MSKEKNIYLQKAKQKSLTGLNSAPAKSETKGDFTKTAAYTGRDILIGGIGGSLAGALAGRVSLLIGMAVTGAAHYFGSPTTAMFGVGMMASGGYQTVAGAMNGTEKEGMEGVKERFKNFQENIKRQLFLDKIGKNKKSGEKEKDESTNGVENVQYFKHPQNEEMSGLDYTEANRIEEQIKESARQFEQKTAQEMGEVSGTENDLNGLGDISDRLI